MPDSNNVPFLQLADLIQSVSSQNQSGVLTITRDQDVYRVVFQNGHIAACTNPKGGALYEALCWLQILEENQLSPFFSGDITDMEDIDLAQIVSGQGLVNEDGIRDAIDSIIEEVLTEILGWQKPDMNFTIDGEANEWEHYQIQLGTMIPCSGLLMEGLRRQDELSRYSHYNHNKDDLLIAENMPEEVEEQLDEASVSLWENWLDDHTIGQNLRKAHLPPWQGLITLSILQHNNLLRAPTAAELIVLANNLHDHEKEEKEILLRKAIALGADNAHLHLTLAELSLSRKDSEQASRDLLAGAEDLQTQDADAAINALNKVLELGIHSDTALHTMVHIYRSNERQQPLAETLLKLGLHNREQGKYEEALQAANEARDLGADTLACEQLLAECSIKQFDKEQALMHLELAVHAAQEGGREEDRITILQQMIGISPGHVAAARNYAEYLTENGQPEAAKTIIEQALNDPRAQHVDEEVVQLREILAQVDPDDTANHDWLAGFYQQHKDRVAASAQLLKLADAQEKDQRYQELTETLDRIIEMAGKQTPLLLKQARLQAKLGYESRSIRTWDALINKLTQTSEVDLAREYADEALTLFPSCKELHIRRGKLANKAGERNKAIYHYRRAVYLAHGSGHHDLARKLIAQLLVLQPEDVMIRCQLADIAVEDPQEDYDQILHNLIKVAVKSNNIGIALERARQRVERAQAPAFDARSELIELLRRCDLHQEEKQEGLSLFHDLIDAGEYQRALGFLERLVASSSGQDSTLVFQLAELYEALEQTRQAVRYYRHAVTLFQEEDNRQEAMQSLQQLLKLTDKAPDVVQAVQLLQTNQAINWESIRSEVKTNKHGSKSFRKSDSSTIKREQQEARDH